MTREGEDEKDKSDENDDKRGREAERTDASAKFWEIVGGEDGT